MKKNKFIIFIFSLLIFGNLSFFYLSRTHITVKPTNIDENYTVTDPPQPYIIGDDYSDILLGDPKAPVTVYAFLSYTCPHCQWFETTQLPILKKDFVDQGKVKFVFKSFPLNLPALQATSIVQCLPNDQKLIAQQNIFNHFDSLIKDWKDKTTGNLVIQNIIGIPLKDQDFIIKCSNNNDSYNKILDTEKKYEKLYKINGTPTFFVGQYKISGAIKAEGLENIIKKVKN